VDFSQTSFSLTRSLSSYSKVQEAVSAVIRNRRPFMQFKTKGYYLDIGCGPNMHPQYINLDYTWKPGMDICCDVTKGLPLTDSYVRGIFTEHCLEHLPFEAVPFVLKECLRVMMPGGLIRVIVPDLEIYVRALVSSSPIPYGDGDATPAVSFNHIFYEHDHKFVYDSATMSLLLHDAGFVEIAPQSFGKGADPILIVDTPSRAIESLYIEAQKPLSC